MITLSERAMQPNERAALARELTESPDDLGLTPGFVAKTLAVLVIAAGACVLAVAMPMPVLLAGTLLGLGGTTIAVCLFLLWVARVGRQQVVESRRWFEQHRRPQLERLLADNRVRAATFTARRAVFFEQFDDEGDLFVFELRDDLCLIVEGETIWPRHPNANTWVGATFELVETPDGDDFLGVFGDASELAIESRYRGEAMDREEFSDAATAGKFGDPLAMRSRPFEAYVFAVPLAECLSHLEAQPC